MSEYQVSISKKASTVADPNNVRTAILAAARECFSRFGIKKTTIEDISNAAQVSRPTFYRFYKNKRELLLNIAIEEMQRISNHSTKLQKKYKDIDDVFTEAILHNIVESQKSDVVRFLLSPENEDLTIQVVESAKETWQLQNLGWEKLLERAKREKRLRKGVEFGDVSKWITIIETLMIIHSRAINSSKTELRQLIKMFIIPSILIVK